MKEQLIELLETFGFPVMLQGSLLPDEPYPETFITFWNDSTDDESFYDNSEHSCVWSFTLNVYSSSPETVNSLLIQVKQLLKQNGWIVMGKGYDSPSDEPSHTGRGIDVIFIEREAQNEYQGI